MKIKKYIIIILLSLILLFSASCSFMLYDTNYNTQDWFKEETFDGKYVVIGRQIGNPFLFGDTGYDITIRDVKNYKALTAFSGDLDSGGEELSNKNCDIISNNEYIKIVLYTYDGKIDSVHRFYYEDFIR